VAAPSSISSSSCSVSILASSGSQRLETDAIHVRKRLLFLSVWEQRSQAETIENVKIRAVQPKGSPAGSDRSGGREEGGGGQMMNCLQSRSNESAFIAS
jgi:hypothetical protein